MDSVGADTYLESGESGQALPYRLAMPVGKHGNYLLGRAAIRRFGFASAVALEPSPENFLGLRLNLLANHVEERVTALQLAAGARDVLLVPRRDHG